MEYTQLMLFGLGVLGIFLHNLMKMDSLNRQSLGNFNIWQYLKIEKFSILLSLGVIIGATVASIEVRELTKAGKYLALPFIAIGYCAQSILVKVMGLMQKKIDNTLKISNMGQYVQFDADTDEVSKFNGNNITSVPLPDVPSFAANNGMNTILNDGAAYYKLLYTASEIPFSIVINGQALTSTGFAGGRPPLRPR